MGKKKTANSFYKKSKATEGDLQAFLDIGALRQKDEMCDFEVISHPKSESVLIIDEDLMYWIDRQDFELYKQEKIKAAISTNK